MVFKIVFAENVAMGNFRKKNYHWIWWILFGVRLSSFYFLNFLSNSRFIFFEILWKMRKNILLKMKNLSFFNKHLTILSSKGFDILAFFIHYETHIINFYFFFIIIIAEDDELFCDKKQFLQVFDRCLKVGPSNAKIGYFQSFLIIYWKFLALPWNLWSRVVLNTLRFFLVLKERLLGISYRFWPNVVF